VHGQLLSADSQLRRQPDELPSGGPKIASDKSLTVDFTVAGLQVPGLIGAMMIRKDLDNTMIVQRFVADVNHQPRRRLDARRIGIAGVAEIICQPREDSPAPPKQTQAASDANPWTLPSDRQLAGGQVDSRP
jgi:hypothetical protein